MPPVPADAALSRRMRDALAVLPPAAAPPPPIDATEHAARIAALRARMAETGTDALLVGAGPGLRYLTGLPWHPTERLVALLLRADGDAHLVCPAFELGSLAVAIALPVPPLPWEEDEDPAAVLAARLPRGARLALDGELPFRVARAVGTLRPDLSVGDATPLLDAGRARKSAAELRILDHAAAITARVHALVATVLEPGLGTAALRAFVDAAHRALGAPDGASFVAAQFDHATAFPHGIPGEQCLQPDALVLVDTGCVLHGYHSDMTRTVRFGTPDAEQDRIWHVEREAQQAAFDAVRPGQTPEAVDAAARRVLERHGLGPGYRLPGLPHRTGHGLGLAIHEAPYIVRGNTVPLEPGMCFSIEPMIVLPDRFGIRLEDCVVVTDTGARWFSTPLDSPELVRCGR